MIRTLVLKELHDHLLSLRFQLGFLLALVLVSGAAFVLSTDYRRATEERYQRLRAENEFVRRYAHLNRITSALDTSRPPSPVVLVRGLRNDSGIEVLDSNPMPDLFGSLDLAAIVTVVFSLFGIVLGFDAVNGERERGTLRLALSNPLRRFEVLAAKWLAGNLVLALALAASLAAGAAIVLAVSGAHWSAAEWGAAVAIGAFSLLYAGAFFSLALLASTLARRSSISVLAAVFAWVLLVVVVPNISPYIAAQFVRVSSVAAVERDIQYVISDQRDEVGRALSRKVYQKYRGVFDMEEAQTPAGKQRLASDPAYRKLYEQVRDELEHAWDEANRIQGEKGERMTEADNNCRAEQFRLSQRISYASPSPAFLYAATDLALTGFRSREEYTKQVDAYRRGPLRAYFERRYREEQAKNPAFGWDSFLDISGRPRFTYLPSRLSDRLSASMRYAGMLAAWNAAFVLGAVVAFVRYDVR